MCPFLCKPVCQLTRFQRLADSTHQTKKALGSIIEKDLASAFTASVKHASKQVEDIAGKWGLAEKKGGYGVTWGTYRVRTPQPITADPY